MVSRLFVSLSILAIITEYSLAQNTPAYKNSVLSVSRRVDEYLERTWKSHGVTPAPLADDYVYFRRLNLDLRGKIPTLIELHDFIDDPNSEKRWEWVERFLAEPRYVQHFARVWRRIIVGEGTTPQAQAAGPAFEAWMRGNLKSDVPMDQMVQRLLSPTLYNRNVDFNQYERGADGSAFFLVNEYKPENIASATARVFLGVKIECAQCHKHPFAKWTREQFWEFAAFYTGLPNRNRVIGDAQPKVKLAAGKEIRIPETDKVVKAKFLNGDMPDWTDASSGSQVMAEWVANKKNPFFARAMVDHLWSYFFGTSLHQPIVEPADDGQVTHEPLLDLLANELIAHEFDLKYLLRVLVHTKAYQRTSGGSRPAEPDDYHLFLRVPIRSLSADQLFDSVCEATDFRVDPEPTTMAPAFGMPMNNTPRAQFLAKFPMQERTYDPQTTILQSLFMMNGKFLNDRTKVGTNPSLRTLATQKTAPERKINSLYLWVLCRPPRSEEMSRSLRYLEITTASPERAMEDLYWSLLNSPEFLLNH